MVTVLFLLISNIFMTVAWYGHLKFGHDWPLWRAIGISWLIAGVEYCFAVPANRLGYGTFTASQLKIMQEAITLVVFVAFAVFVLKERVTWNYLAAFACILLAVAFAFGFKPTAG